MRLGWRMSSLQIDGILYKEFVKVKLYFAGQNLYKADNRKGTKCRRNLRATVKCKKSVVIGKRNWRISIKISSDLNRDRFCYSARCTIMSTTSWI